MRKRKPYHLLVALQFLTRFPVPKDLNPRQDDLSKSGLYFPLVGVILGVAGWLIYKIATFIGFSTEISTLLAIISVMLMTGGFHEDGLADTFDGWGGSFSKERKLEIMKDSRLGTYGSLALISAILMRFTALSQVSSLFGALVVSLMMGRLSSIVIIPFSGYASIDGQSRSKPIIEAIGKNSIIPPIAGSFIVSTLCFGFINSVILFIVLGLICIFMLKLSERQISGYTGDVLGAINICCELATLMLFTLL